MRNYLKTKDTYAAYRKAGYSKRFATEHQDEIQLHKAAKKAFDSLGTKQISSIRMLQEEYAELVEKKKALILNIGNCGMKCVRCLPPKPMWNA
jgi:L-lysine 2,3-aminomutase